MGVPRSLASAVMICCVLGGLAGARSAPAPRPVVTLAGTGALGMADGPAHSATFLMPTGLALGGDGTLYVADEAGQRIRAVAHDVVRTVAGSGNLVPPGLSVAGGYRDGPALQARFNRPTALAIGPDGALYIADANNACIRKLQGGVVSTVAGTCGERGRVDGDRNAGRFNDPRALAFDAAGNLYVADFDCGVRKLDRNGTLTTLHFKSIGDRRVWGLTIGGLPNDPTLVATFPYWAIVDHLATGLDEALNTNEGAEGGRAFGMAGQIAPLDHREYVFADPRSSDVRYLRLPATPFATTDFTRVIAGGRLERAIDNAGFADGSYAASRFYAPGGIALANGYAYVADTGNRRIRRVALPPFGMSEAGLEDRAPYDARHVEVAYIGASWAYWDSLDHDSICGHLETELDAARRFRKPVRCHPMRIDAATFPQIENYLAAYLPARVDLVVINTTLAEVDSIFPNSAPPSADAALAAFETHLRAVQSRLGPRTRLLLFWTWDSDDVSDAENMLERQDNPNRRTFPGDIVDNYAIAAKRIADAVARMPGVFECDSYPAFIAYEKSAGAGPLYGTNDSHLSPRGAALAAHVLARCIEREKRL